jgi:hypothetical protein
MNNGETGLVRLLTQPKIDDIAKRVTVIHCSSCGAPVNLKKDHACPRYFRKTRQPQMRYSFACG